MIAAPGSLQPEPSPNEAEQESEDPPVAPEEAVLEAQGSPDPGPPDKRVRDNITRTVSVQIPTLRSVPHSLAPGHTFPEFCECVIISYVL
jgi:hypothetical protein